MPQVRSANSSPNSLRVALVIIVAATVLSLSMGLRQSLGLFLGPISGDLAVSVSAFGFAAVARVKFRSCSIRLYFASSANPLTISVRLTSRLNLISLTSANSRLPR